MFLWVEGGDLFALFALFELFAPLRAPTGLLLRMHNSPPGELCILSSILSGILGFYASFRVKHASFLLEKQ